MKVLWFRLLLDWFCPQCSNAGSNIIGIQRDRLRPRFKRREFELHLLPVFGANLDEGMNCADCHVKSDSVVKNTNDVALRAAFAPQLADQFAVSFEFGARWFLRDRIQQGKKGRVHDLQAPEHLASQSDNSPITRLHSPISALV